jgi:hypothetical protein
MALNLCPERSLLRDFSIGNLSGNVFERVSRHLEHCPMCSSVLECLEEDQDEVTRGLRELADGSESGQPVVPDVLLAVAARASRGVSKDTSTEVVIDSGRRIAEALTSGAYHLGKFELLEQLGAGTFGYVFRARDTELNRIVAVKVSRAGTLASASDTDRVVREARSAARLKHPNIVSVYETAHTEDGACYLVTEFVAGETLQSRIGSRRLRFDEAAALVAQIAVALQYAHEQGIIHRDLKPSNIMLDAEGRPHVLDFGLAKCELGETTLTQEGDVMGTPAYMSPEQARGHSHLVDARSDIYSLGVILYELVTGERPFQGNRRMLLLQVLEEEPRPPRRLEHKLPRDLETICLKAMAKSPGRRYLTAQELADDLFRYLDRKTIRARPVGWPEVLGRWCLRNPVAAALLGAVSVGSLAGLLYLSSLAEYFVQQTALESARMQSEVLDVENELYSEIVQRLEENHIEVTHDWDHKPRAVPLPATFTIEASRRMTCNDAGMQVRLYSDFPFPWREDGGPRDRFEELALSTLRQNPDQPFYEFTELDGRPTLRFATARQMTASCIECHNTHPETPKSDWKAGDVRGVLELIRPLDREIAQTQKGLQGAVILMGGVSIALVGGSLVLARAGNRRRSQ